MKVLFLDIKIFFANSDMLEAFYSYRDSNGQSLDVYKYPYEYDEKKVRNDPEFESNFKSALVRETPDFVFSFNFLPVVSKVCNKEGVKYVSWIYDNPHYTVYAKTAFV